MNHHLKTRAIILHQEPFKESGALITLLTRSSGILHARALGVKKFSSKLASSLLTGNVVYLTLVKNIGWHITGAKVISSSGILLLKAQSFHLTSMVRELLIKIIKPGLDVSEIYTVTEDYLSLMQNKNIDIATKEKHTYYSILRILAHTGVLPTEYICQVCGNKKIPQGQIHWNISRGYIDKNCLTTITDTPSIALTPHVQRFLKLDPSVITDSYTTFDKISIGKIIADIFEREIEQKYLSLQNV